MLEMTWYKVKIKDMQYKTSWFTHNQFRCTIVTHTSPGRKKHLYSKESHTVKDSRHLWDLENQPSQKNKQLKHFHIFQHPTSSTGESVPPVQLPAPHRPTQHPAAPHVQLSPPVPTAAAVSAAAAHAARLRLWRCRPSTRAFRPRISG